MARTALQPLSLAGPRSAAHRHGTSRLVAAVGCAILCAAADAGAEAPPAEQTTFTREVAPILYDHCLPCHRPGGAGPFPLRDYADARKRARQIVDVTRDRYMPPWLPRPGAVHFANERRLTDDQIDTLRRWVTEGLAEGDAGDLPPPPRVSDTWQLGIPDLVVAMPEDYTLPAEGPDVFRNFVIPIAVTGRRWVRAWEFDPGNPRVVHHAVMNFDRSRSSRRLDALDPDPGFGGMVGSGMRSIQGHFVAWTPGNLPEVGPPDMAWQLDEGTDLVLQLHLLPSGKPEPIRAALALYFADGPPARVPYLLRLGSKTLDIPAGETAYRVEDSYRLPVDVDAIGIYPHAHYLGRTMEGWAALPDGRRLELIRIDDWDFNWQDDYRYAAPLFLPRGTMLHMRYTYDNSRANVRNPHDPPRRVRFGPQSSDEMGDLWLQVTPRDARELVVLQRDFEHKDALAHIAGYETLLREEPEHVDALNAAALLELRIGRVDRAAARLERSLRVDPDNAEAHNYLGLALLAQGQPQAAIEHYRRAVRLEPDYAEAHNNLGVALRAQGDAAGAIEHYRAVLHSEPDHARAHGNLGVALHGLGRLDEAVAHYRRALELAPDSSRTRFNLSAALESTGDSEGAIAQLREAVGLDPSFAAAQSKLGQLLYEAGRLDDALSSFLASLQHRPDSPADLNAAAWILATHPDAGRRDGPQAVALAERAVELTRRADAGVLGTLAAAHAADGQYERAEQVAREALARAREARADALVHEIRRHLDAYARRLPLPGGAR